MYSLIRIALFTMLFGLFFILIKRKRTFGKKFVVLSVLLWMCACSASYLLPVENLFIDFKTPQQVFNYTRFGEIKDIAYGEESCMVYYKNTNDSYSHTFVLNSKDGYKISNSLKQKTILHKFDKNVYLDIYNVSETNDYYVVAAINSKDGEFEVYNGRDEKVNCDVKTVENTNFVYFYLKDFTNEHYLLVNGEKILLTD